VVWRAFPAAAAVVAAAAVLDLYCGALGLKCDM
jgi:hypothetical protein